ncbi:MAG TPA: DUF1289 domain-containing protein [Burkholderiaceae bacterium]|nr:DUF1289 domain-containing protein [Burkholderiaceae bacterium]
MTIPSPCTSVCQMDVDSQWCKGCWRTLDEIATWSTSTDAMKQQVWVLIEQRKSNQRRSMDRTENEGNATP